MRRAPWIGCVLALAAAVPSRADETCPIDGTRLTLPPQAPWNSGGGVDSDGCTYAVDGAGRARVVGIGDLVVCPRCFATLQAEDLGRLAPSGDECVTVRQAVGPYARDIGGAPLDRLGTAQRVELALVTYRGLGPSLTRLGLDPDAVAGELLLRAAWAARGLAVLGGDEDDPVLAASGPAELGALLAALEEHARRRPSESPADALLAHLEQARAALDEAARLGAPATRLVVLRASAALSDLERGILAGAARAADRADSPALPRGPALALLLARACARWGDPAARQAWLDEAAQAGAGDAAARLAEACAEEARFLSRAVPLLRAAAARTAAGGERARLLWLAGDAARRTGDADTARATLRAAVDAAPQDGPEAERLRALLLALSRR